MERTKLAALVGAAACVATVLAVAAPYVALPDPTVVSEYYGLGAVSPLAEAFIGMVGAVAFAAGAYDRSDPELVAGLMLVAGVVSLLVAVEWALAFDGLRVDLATEDTYGTLDVHRWTVVGGTALWTAAATAYAAWLGLLGVGGE